MPTFQSIKNDTIKIYERLSDDLSKRIFECRMLYSLTDNYKFIDDIIDSSPDLNAVKYNLKRILESKDNIIAYGAGMKGMRFVKLCKSINIKIDSFCDADINKQKGVFLGYRVISPTELKESDIDCYIVITPVNYQGIVDNLVEMGFRYEQIFILSKYITDSINTQYFDTSILPPPRKDEIFIDAGCCDCATTNEFIKWSHNSYKKIIAFEPNPKQYDICHKLSRKIIDFTVYPYGLWNDSVDMGFIDDTTNSGGGKISLDSINNSVRISTVKLDDIIDGDKATFIKMDVEGSELNALKGASHTIGKYRPKLAISLYHKPEDVWEIPRFILSLNEEYKLYIRHYLHDEPETVLYAF